MREGEAVLLPSLRKVHLLRPPVGGGVERGPRSPTLYEVMGSTLGASHMGRAFLHGP